MGQTMRQHHSRMVGEHGRHHTKKLIKGIKAGDIWLNKVKYEGTKRIRGNVCLEVYLPSRGTCLLQHVNLGACEFEDIPNAFVQGMSQLCELHSRTGVGETGEYLSPTEDRQVGLGVLGLANLLRRHGVSYEQFGRALDQFHAERPSNCCLRTRPTTESLVSMQQQVLPVLITWYVHLLLHLLHHVAIDLKILMVSHVP